MEGEGGGGRYMEVVPYLITPVQPHKCLSCIQIEASISLDGLIFPNPLHQHWQRLLIMLLTEQQIPQVGLGVVVVWSLVQNLFEVLFCLFGVSCPNISST